MKQPIVIVAALAMGFSVNAQSLEEGIKMYHYNRYESAKKELQPLAGSNATANYYLGLAELGLENTQAAQTTFTKYTEDPANKAGMARVQFINGNAQQGMKTAKEVADDARRKEWQQLQYAADAITYTSGGDIQQAIDWYKTAIEREPNNAMLHISLGDAYQKVQGGGGEAMNNYEKAVEIGTNKSLAYSRIGALWYAAKNYDLALESYQKAKDADPNNPLPYKDLANAYYWVNKFDLAKQNIEEYLKRSDKSTEDQLMYVSILYLAKDYQNAVQKAEELMKSGVNKASLYGILAYSQMEMQDSVMHAKALENVRNYFRLQERAKIFPSDYMNYAKIVMLNKMIDSADYYYAMAISQDTAQDKSATYRKIAEGFKDAKDYNKSGEWYGKLVKAYPESPAIDYFWWGVMHYYGKDYEKATNAFEQMRAKYPDEPSGIYWSARVAAATDEEAKEGSAVPYYTQWLDMQIEGYERKASDLMYAYQYLALYHYNQNAYDKAEEFADKVLEIEANNSFGKQIKDAIDKARKK